jgi:hypothetical protein
LIKLYSNSLGRHHRLVSAQFFPLQPIFNALPCISISLHFIFVGL